jgi:hypothetical protein
MNPLHVIETFLLIGAAVYLMMLSGIAKSALEPRRARRVCPSCGRVTSDCRCQP